MYVFNIKVFQFYLELRLKTPEISLTKSDRCISKIWISFSSFLTFLENIKFGHIKLNLAFFKMSFGFVCAQKHTIPGARNISGSEWRFIASLTAITNCPSTHNKSTVIDNH